MNVHPYETYATVVLHRRALRQEAERERLLAAGRSPRASVGPFLARTGRLLIAIGTWLETRYARPASAAPTHAISGQSRRPSYL